MAKSIIANTASSNFFSYGSSRYIALVDYGFSTTTEANTQTLFRTAGVLSGTTVRVQSNSSEGACTFKTRINGSNGAQSVSIPANSTGVFSDSTNTDTIAAGDKVNYYFTYGGTFGSIFPISCSCVFDANTNTVGILGSSKAITFNTANGTRYIPLTSLEAATGSTESLAQAVIQASVTAKNLGVYISSNARTTTTTIRSRKNGANGNLSVSIGSTATGWFEDTSNSDSLVSGDKYTKQIVLGSDSSNIIVNVTKIEFESTNGDSHFIASHIAAFDLSTSTKYTFINGQVSGLTWNSTEGWALTGVRAAMTLSRLYVQVDANSVATGGTVRLRKNNANGNLVVSIPGSTTGTFTDTTNSDSVAVGDVLSYSSIRGSGTSLTVSSIGVLANVSPSSVNVTVNSTVQSAAFSTQAAVITAIKNVSIAAAVIGLVASLIAPSIVAEQNALFSPPVQQVTSAIQSPSIAGSANISASVQSAAFSVQPPAFVIDCAITPGVLSVLAALQAPAIQTDQVISAGVQQATFSLPAPVVGVVVNVAPATLPAAIAVQSPQVSTGATISPGVQNLTITAQSPSVVIATTVQAVVQALAATVIAPTVSGSALIVASAQTASFSGQAVTIYTDQVINAAAQTATFTINAVTIITGTTIVPATHAATFSTQPPTITAVRNVEASAGVQGCAFTVIPPAIQISQLIAAGVQSAQLVTNPVAVMGEARIAVAVVSVSFNFQTSHLQLGVTCTVSPCALTVAVQPPTVTAWRRVYPYTSKTSPYGTKQSPYGRKTPYTPKVSPYGRQQPYRPLV